MKINNETISVTDGIEAYVPSNVILEFHPENSSERAKVLSAFLTVKSVAENVTHAGMICKKNTTKRSTILWHIAVKDEKAIITVKCDICKKKKSFFYEHRNNIQKDAYVHMIKKSQEVLNDQSRKPHFVHWIDGL